MNKSQQIDLGRQCNSKGVGVLCTVHVTIYRIYDHIRIQCYKSKASSIEVMVEPIHTKDKWHCLYLQLGIVSFTGNRVRWMLSDVCLLAEHERWLHQYPCIYTETSPASSLLRIYECTGTCGVPLTLCQLIEWVGQCDNNLSTPERPELPDFRFA